MVLLAAQPYMMARAVDDGLVPGRPGVLRGWTVAMFRGRGGERLAEHHAAPHDDAGADGRQLRTVKVVVDHVVRLGAALPRRAGAGEVVTIGVGDVQDPGAGADRGGAVSGSVVVYAVVAGLLLAVSVPLAAVVLLGVPVIALLTGR
ncbi:hypothetical protein GCM10017687_53060 [Streptomyces echinatus]|uniref:hypothetical protein n=1 Tax=Streptomyces echinatus TaxID=67293 RepID=UPI0033852EF7